MSIAEDKELIIRDVSIEVRQLIRMYADVNDCTQVQMLERIVLEWNTQQSGSERPSPDEDE